MSKQVDQDNPTLGQTSNTYDDSKVKLASKLRDHEYYTLGNVLTTIEAAVIDTRQFEAVKSIVKREFYAMIERNQAEVYVQAGMQEFGLAPAEIHLEQNEDGETVYSSRQY